MYERTADWCECQKYFPILPNCESLFFDEFLKYLIKLYLMNYILTLMFTSEPFLFTCSSKQLIWEVCLTELQASFPSLLKTSSAAGALLRMLQNFPEFTSFIIISWRNQVVSGKGLKGKSENKNASSSPDLILKYIISVFI